MARLKENARAVRAVLALTVAMTLAGLIFSAEQQHAREQARMVRQVNMMLWGISELSYVSQRLVTALHDQSYEPSRYQATQVRFDVVWSRADVIKLERFSEGTGFHEFMADFRVFLEETEPVLFAEEQPSPATLRIIAQRLTTLSVRNRQLWLRNFGTINPADQILDELSPQIGHDWAETAAGILTAILVFYVMFEVLQASRDQQRERALRVEASRASEAKSRFLANVSHEIRTPLNGILGMASELSESELTEDQAHCLRVIEQSGGVLLGTINDVLDLSKVEAGQIQIQDRAFVLRDVLEAAVALYSARAREKGLELSIDIKWDVPRVVSGDGRRLRQVLHNLVANAVKFTESGRVSVVAQRDLDQNFVSIEVRDSGPGISDEAREKIFEPFTQGDPGVARQHGGTGLGLTISRQLCEAMGGRLLLLECSSNGSTFMCRLPLREVTEEERVAPTHQGNGPVNLEGRRVLVADDNATNRLILDRFLKSTKVEVVMACNGAEAYEMRMEEKFDLILMDVQMPRMGGVEATMAIRAWEIENDIPPVPIIGVTANAMRHQIEEYEQAGMNEVLAKPVAKAALMRSLSGYFATRAAA